jgi:hypothetical protein
MSSHDHRERPTTPPPPRPSRPPTKITIYRTKAGVWELSPTPGCIAVEADLAEGYRVAEGVGGVRYVVGAKGGLGMTADEAVRARVLHIPVVQK